MKNHIASAVLALGLTVTGATAAHAGPGPDQQPTAPTCVGSGWVDSNVCSGHPLSPAESQCAVAYLTDATVYRTDPTCQPFAQYLVRASDGNQPPAQPPVQQAPKQHAPRPVRVVVKRHDTLWHLALVHLGSGRRWACIARENGIHGACIRVGQVLRIW